MPRLKPQIQPLPITPRPLTKVFHSVEEAAEILSLGRTTIFALIRDGHLRAVRIGKRRLVAASELEAFAVRCQEGANGKTCSLKPNGLD